MHQERLELLIRAYLAHHRGDPAAYKAALDQVYAAVGDDTAASEALHTVFAAQGEAMRAGGSQEKRDAMAAVGVVALADWVGCDVETLASALADALEVERR